MRALVFNGKNKKLIFDANYPEPQPQAGKKAIRVIKAGICNTDLELVKGYDKGNTDRIVLGHEFVGITEEGQRIVGEINISCGHCEFCQHGMMTHCLNRSTLGIMHYDGAFADNIILPQENIYSLPDTVSDDQADRKSVV